MIQYERDLCLGCFTTSPLALVSLALVDNPFVDVPLPACLVPSFGLRGEKLVTIRSHSVSLNHLPVFPKG
jgi:hypothetical protein